MKLRSLLLLAVLVLAPAARAADNTWTNAAGDGVWDHLSANWTSPAVWNQGDYAIFGPNGAGAVVVPNSVEVSGITFDAPGYVIQALTPSNGIRIYLSRTFVVNADATIAARISDTSFSSGGLTKAGAGTLTLLEENTYTGATIVSEGTLALGDGGTIGSVSGNIANSAAVVFNRSDTHAFSKEMTGTGSVTKVGVGSLELTGKFLHTGGTTIDAGKLLINGGQLTGDVVNNGSVRYGFTPYLTYAGNMSGSGTLFKEGSSSTLILTGANTYTGTTWVINGSLQVGDGGTTGSIAGDVLLDWVASLKFNHSHATSFAGVIRGGGKLEKLGAGTLTLTGANTFLGTTTISGGTLSIGDGGTTGSLEGDIFNNAQLVFNRSDDYTYAGSFSSGMVAKLGGGTLNLTGQSGARQTHVVAGKLSIGIGGSTGSLSGAIINDAEVIFNRSNSSTFFGDISGSGTVIKRGAGTLTLAGNFLHTGGTTISGGTLSLTGNQLTGDVVNNGAVTYLQNNAISTYAGNMSGGGSLTKTGLGGQLTLTGTNTYSGETRVLLGTLQLGDGGTSGSIAGHAYVISSGVLVFNRSDNVTYARNITGESGKVRKVGPNTLSFTGTAKFSGPGVFEINEGTLSIGDGVTMGSIDGDIANNARLVFNNPSAAELPADISGPGIVEKLGAGTLALTGNNTHSGGTTVTAGALSIGNGGFSGSLGGEIVNNAAVIFNRAGSSSFAGNITGPGTLTKLGLGSVAITGSALHAGGTTITAGTLAIGDGGTAGVLTGNVLNNATLAFNRSDAIVYDNVVSGQGTVRKLASGTLTLTAAHDYTGATAIAAGTLALAGTASFSASSRIETAAGSALDVTALTGGSNYDAGAARFATASEQSLAGLGTFVGDLALRAGSSISPGMSSASRGTLSVDGDVDMRPGSKLEVHLDLVAGGDADAYRDRLLVMGDLEFAGTADSLFTIAVASSVASPNARLQRILTIAAADSISSTALDAPLAVVVGANGMAESTNLANVRLQVTGFNQHDKFTLQRSGSLLQLLYQPVIDADFDNDGDVDRFDLTRWRSGFVAGSQSHNSGDADGDGRINGNDFLVWQRQLGQSSPTTPTVNPVPEPSAGYLLAALGILAPFARRPLAA
jgi:fibronectin-binding autotransporter adhesin